MSIRSTARWRELTGSASTAAIAFGLLAGICALLAVAGPRGGAELRTSAFRQIVARAPVIDISVVGMTDDSSLSLGLPNGIDASLISQTQSLLWLNLKALPLAPADTDWSSLTTPMLNVLDNARTVKIGGAPQLELVYRDTLAQNVRVLAGSLPGGNPGTGPVARLQAAVTAQTARRYGLSVGSRLPLPGSGIDLQVTGIVQPRNPAAPFWTTDPIAAAPALVQPMQGAPYWQGGVFVAASAVSALQNRISTSQTQLTWTFPLDLRKLSGAQAISLQHTLAGTLSSAGQLTINPAHVPDTINLTSGVAPLLAEFIIQSGAVSSVLDLLSVSLAVVGAAVVLIAAWLLTEARRAEFAVMRARGASRLQLATVIFGGSVVAAGPGAAVGIAVGVAVTPRAAAPLSWWLAGLMLGVSLAGPVLITVRVHRGYAGAGRPDQQLSRVARARRLVIEAGLVLGAVGGLVVLRDQGLGTADVYTSAAPILIAIPIAVILLRIYPLLVRALLRLAARRAGATAFLGLARAARVPVSAVLPAFAMVLALGLVSFAGMVRGAVSRGEVAASWQEAGADAVITSTTAISPAQRQAIAAVPGVRRVAALGVTSGTLASGRQFLALLVDPAQYAAFLAAAQQPRNAALLGRSRAAGGSGTVTALASPALAPGFGTAPVPVRLGVGSQRVRVQVAGQAPSMSAVGAIGVGSPYGYLLLPSSVLGANAPAPTMLLVAGPVADHGALLRAVARLGSGATVVFRSGLLSALQTAPLQHDVYLVLALGGYAAGAAALLVLLLTLLLTAPSREMTLARINTMGLSEAQGQRLTVIESLPQILSVLVGGVASAAALAPLIGPELSLSVFTGSTTSVPVLIEPAWLAVTAAALLVLAIIAAASQTMLAGLRTPRFLRIGG